MAVASMDSNAERLTDLSPALMARNYKGFTRTQNILDGCAYLVVEEVYG